ncbi:hypothetical protein NEIPOLOT_01420 [Neisseria polysaccharea ATCC 43768]|nr:hypothetical protein NEIPOLOT_01420 [Neisseria polysaccharea ATCC 43768]
MGADVFEAFAGAFVAVGLRGIGINDEVDFAAQIVDNRQFLRQHQQDVGRAERVGFGGVFQAMGEVFEIVDGFVTEVADQSAGKARQAWDFGCFETVVEGFDKGQRIAVVLLDNFAVLVNIDVFAAGFEIVAARQADKGIAAETFATDNGFEQVGIGTVGEFEIEGKRRIQVGKEFLHERDAVVALGGLGLVFLLADHFCFPKRRFQTA